MSFSAQKELGFDKLLFVEGPTEVKTIQQFLRMVMKDRNVLLLPLHGHLPKEDELEELLRITTNAAVLIDSEKTAADSPLESNRAEFLELCASKRLHAHVLDRRATENYFPDNVVKRVFGEEFRGLEPYEKLNQVNPHWGKSDNWRLAAAMTYDDIKGTDLGQFIDQL